MERLRSEIEQPRADYATATPKLRDFRQVESILILLRMAGRYGIAPPFATFQTLPGLTEQIKAFRIGRHHAVLNGVMDHFGEVPRAGRAAMQVALVSCAGRATTRRHGRGRHAWC